MKPMKNKYYSINELYCFISKIDLNYYRKPQTGHYVYVLNNKKYNLRISSLIGKDMDSIVIRILNNHQNYH